MPIIFGSSIWKMNTASGLFCPFNVNALVSWAELSKV